MKTSSYVRATLAALWLAGVVSAPAAAQDRLSIGGWEVVSSGPGFGATVGPAGALNGLLAAGGRYGLLPDRLRDRFSGAEIEFFNALLLSTIAVDPSRPRAFFARQPNRYAPANAVVMADLETGAITPLLSVPGLTGGQVTARFAVDVERLVVSYPDASGLPVGWAVVDLAGGAPVVQYVSIPLVSTFPSPFWAISPDGTRLYRAAVETTPNTSAVVAHDLSTGAETGRVPMLFALGARIEWSDALDAVVDTREGPGTVTFTAFTRDLQPIVSAPAPVISGPCSGAQVVVSPSSNRVYMFTGGGNYFGVTLPALLTGFTLGTSGPVDATDVAPEAKGNCGGMQLATPPGAPRRLSATVTSGTVAFAWENVGGASQFTVDVGIGPGRTDLSIPQGPDSHWTIAGAPPGTYYVRVRGANTFGGGRPSQEIQVVVP